jgi:hypothetical protein
MEDELERVEHLHQMKHEPSPRGKQYTKSSNSKQKKKKKKELQSPKHHNPQIHETVHVEPTAIRLNTASHYPRQNYPNDAMMEPYGTRIETYYRPPGRTMSSDETTTDISMSLAQAAVAAQKQHIQKSKSKKRQVNQYYQEEGRRGYHVARDPEVNVGSPTKSRASTTFRRAPSHGRRNKNNDSCSSSQYTDDSSYSRSLESAEESYY